VARMRKDRRGNEEDSPTFGACLACRQDNPHARHQHYLLLARQTDLKAAKEHIYLDLLDRFKGDTERATARANDTAAWLHDQIEPFRNMVDEQTGEVLPWWEARRLNILAIHETYAKIGEREREKAAARAAHSRRRVGTFTRLEPTVGTPFPDAPPRPDHLEALEASEGMPLADDDYTDDPEEP
jgi:hypothetical protein